MTYPRPEVELQGSEDPEVVKLGMDFICLQVGLLQTFSVSHVVQEWVEGVYTGAAQALDDEGSCDSAWLVLDLAKYVYPIL